MGCYIWYSEEGPGRAGAPPSPLLAVPNVTPHPLTASVPITVLMYNTQFLCSFNVGIEGLRSFPQFVYENKGNLLVRSPTEAQAILTNDDVADDLESP